MASSTRSTSSRWWSFSVCLPRLPSRFNLGPLSSISLGLVNDINSTFSSSDFDVAENVLAGDTCDPISLADFEAYLAYKEYSIENLQFAIWFRDYRKRFLRAPEAIQISQDSGQRSNYDSGRDTQVEVNPDESLVSIPSFCSSTAPTKDTTRSPSCRVSVDIPRPETALMPPERPFSKPKAGTPFRRISDKDQPFWMECMHVLATFLRPGSVKELNLDQSVRDALIRNLAISNHPDVFIPVYNEVYRLLETISLIRFLRLATTNINLPRQLLWYAIGTTDLIIGLVIAISFIMMKSTPPQYNRAWRLISIPFLGIASVLLLAGWKGFCNNIRARGNTQVRVWEMQRFDEESKVFFTRVLSRSPESPHVTDINSVISSTNADLCGIDKCISPSAYPDEENDDSHSSNKPTLNTRPSSLRATGFVRPGIFGPERVVLDPRVKEAHRQVLKDISRLGVWAVLVLLVFA